MPKGMPKRGDELQPIEGGGAGAGGGGSGMSTASKIGVATGAAGTVAGQLYHIDKANKLTKERREAEKEKREADAEIKRESRGMAKGGMTASKRADGIAQRGRTRGKMY